MVFYYTSNVVDPPATLYMGRDKFENEDLIKFGFDIDVWFHVDKMSSAHVYLRLPPGMTWDTIPEPLLQDLAQLTKANSIEGNKKNDITVIYTPWSNLKKQAGMETGQVSFFKGQTVKRVHVAKRENSIINRLEKTRVELSPDFAAEKIAWEKEVRLEKREQEKMRKQAEMLEIEEKRKAAGERSYDHLFKEKNMKSNKELVDDDISNDRARIDQFEEDFM